MLARVLGVFIGGGLGAVARWGVGAGMARLVSPSVFPAGTLAINVVGCLLMGIVMHALERRELIDSNWRFFLAVGVLGGFTTFSAFGAEAEGMFRDGATGKALGYAAASVVLCVAAVWVGRGVARLVGA